MIRKVWLRNWKAYDSVELTFDAGTTFLVAENGIGKSSLVQGIYFALFGSPFIFGTDRPVNNAVRGIGDAIGTAGCEVSLGSSLIRLERTVAKQSNTGHTVKIEIDGRISSEEEWHNLFQAETGVDATQLGLLAFVAEGATISLDDAGLSVVEMLAEVFGVERLRRASEEYELMAKRLARENDNLRKSLRDRPSKHDTKQSAQLQQHLDRLTARLDELRTKQRIWERSEDLRQDWLSYHSDIVKFQRAADIERERVSNVLAKMRFLIPASIPTDVKEISRDTLRAIINDITKKYEELISNRGRLQGEREASLRDKDVLSGGEPICPTCRQPLSRDAANRAIAEHQENVARSTADLVAIDAYLLQLRSLLTEAQALISGPEPAPPSRPSKSLGESTDKVEIDAAALKSEIEELGRKIVESTAELAVLKRMDDQRNQDALLSARLLEGYRTVERGQLAATTMARLADAICAERIMPMANELQKRWLSLTSDSKLSMDATGALSLEEAGYVVSYSGLSGGQRTLAQLAVRLLALQMATRCPFMVLDEPLEHLDPRNRRSLATLLVRATYGSSRLQQVLVTTYEESVTRRLSAAPISSDDSEGSSTPAARVVRISANRQS